jgi:predicted HTH domain antitoxin
MVGSRLPRELIDDLELIERTELSDRSAVVRRLLQRATREWKLEHYAQRYADGTMSVAQAAQQSGVSLWEMMEQLRSRKVPCQYDFQEWEQDVATVEKLVARQGGSGLPTVAP